MRHRLSRHGHSIHLGSPTSPEFWGFFRWRGSAWVLLVEAAALSLRGGTWRVMPAYSVPAHGTASSLAGKGDVERGRDESVRRGAGSQWIVAARPLCHLQCPVAYLSRLQRIQPAARWEGSFGAACRGSSAGQAEPMARALGALKALTWVGASGGHRRRLLAWILT